MTSINNNIPANILSTTINTRAHITTTHAIRTMDIGYSVSQQLSHNARIYGRPFSLGIWDIL